MQAAFRELLRCPYCRSALAFAPAAHGFGVLSCRCDRWPVVDDIPILCRTPLGVHEHTTGDAAAPRTDYNELVALIESGEWTEALVRCLSFPVELPRLARLVGWRASQSRTFTRLRYALCEPQVRRLLSRRDSVSAVDLFNFFCRPDSPLGEGPRDYFILRFGQPRHIAALALLENLRSADRPVLDVACGAGHFDHYLTQRRRAASVVGTDINFFQLWIARHWIAPRAQYVCADLRDGLPLASDAFSAVFCSDAYHYVPNRRTLLEEMERCAPGGLSVLTRVGNARIGPHEGCENTVDGYLREIGARARVFDEFHLVRDYLSRRNPFAGGDSQEPSEHKWLSFAWNVPEQLEEISTDWPHAVGRTVLNPVYEARPDADGWDLKHAFPSPWFAFENGQMLTYQPRRARVTRVERHERTQELAEQFILIGVPARYCREPRFPARSRGARADRGGVRLITSFGAR